MRIKGRWDISWHRSNPVSAFWTNSRFPTTFTQSTTGTISLQQPLTLAPIMSALTATAGTLARCARQQLPSTARAAVAVATQQRRSVSEVSNTSSFDSPFKGMSGSETTKIPSFKKYRTSGGETGNKVFQYFMVGTMGAISALGAKATVQGESTGKRGIAGRLGSILVNSRADWEQQISLSTCPHPPMFWPRPRSKLISAPSQKART